MAANAACAAVQAALDAPPVPANVASELSAAPVAATPTSFEDIFTALSMGSNARSRRPNGLREPPSLEDAARALVETALDAGSDDNVSVVVVGLNNNAVTRSRRVSRNSRS